MKKIVVGVSGSIAVYKSLLLVRSLVKSGWEVRVVMTHAATEFVSALSFSTLSKNQVEVDLIDDDAWNNHVELGLWADALVIAPATATTLSKLVQGQSDNMLIATYLSAKCPVFIAPAMDLDMWKHPSTVENIRKLQDFGNYIIPVGHGELASGLVGDGRMAEPEDIVATLKHFFNSCDDLKGKKVMITAGPTREAIDPVRFIGNHSSGLMGICLAEECAFRGAKVDLILGPTHLSCNTENVKTIPVVTAQEMYEASMAAFDDKDIALLAAAVADYRPRFVSHEKIKKQGREWSIDLERTRDIAFELGMNKKPGQMTVGFALETENEESNAMKKLESKNFDFIVLNSLREKGAGFQFSTNKISILRKDNKILHYELKSKRDVARDIVDQVVTLLDETKAVAV